MVVRLILITNTEMDVYTSKEIPRFSIIIKKHIITLLPNKIKGLC